MDQKIKTLKIIHLAITFGVVLIYFTLGDITALKSFKVPALDAYSVVFLALPLIAVFTSNFVFKNTLKQAKDIKELKDKFGVYQTASIIRWAILEGAAFIILFLKPDFMLFGLLIILYMVFLSPTLDKIKNDFESVRIK
ncbi:MAG: MFS transporter [Cellulophaga sp.]|uniref:MFS transporter n=1 Tax=Cellulophaga sp. TaxID=1972202 RepID=UPI003267C35E